MPEISVDPRYLEDASGFRGTAERLFVPAGENEVLEVLRRASEARAPVTISGAGTGLTGGRVARGGWVLSIEKLNRIEVLPGRAVCGAGAILRDLHDSARRSGQFYPPDPTETSASIGGTIACNASGSRSFRYGDTRRHVLGLRVALMDGRVMEVQRGQPVDFDIPAIPLPRTSKHSAGYRLAPGMDWVDLFVGSEGTLGVVLEAELNLLPSPGPLIAGVVFFPSDDAALDAVDAWRPVPGLRMLEYFDRGSLVLLRAKFEDTPSCPAAILFEQETRSADDEIELWLDRLDAAGAMLDESWFAAGDQDRERFRRFRHALPESVNDAVRRNGFLKLGSDYAVPVERNREMLEYYRSMLESVFDFVIFGHIGDAHVHVNILPRSGAEFDAGRELMADFAREAVRLGGTVGAEHGLGKRKAHLLRIQYSDADIQSMVSVKLRLDPLWLLGRGNLLPEPGER